jgi:ribosomal protein L24
MPKPQPKKASRWAIGDLVEITTGLTEGAKGSVCAVSGRKITIRQLNGNLINVLDHQLRYDTSK